MKTYRVVVLFSMHVCIHGKADITQPELFLMISQKSYRNAYRVQSFSIVKDFKLNLKHTPALGLYWL